MIAVNIEVIIPIDKVIAKPLIGPVPIAYRTMEAMRVVTLASKIVTKAREKAFLNGCLRIFSLCQFFSYSRKD